MRTSVDLPEPGEAHHDEHLAGPDLERDVAHGGDAAGLLAQFGAGEVGVGRADHLARVLAEDLPDPLGADERDRRSVPLEEANRLAPLVDVDVERRGRPAEAGHRLHVAAERNDPAGAGVGTQVAHAHREAGRRVRERRVV